MQGMEPLTDEEIKKIRKWLRVASIIIPPEMLDRAMAELQERRKNEQV